MSAREQFGDGCSAVCAVLADRCRRLRIVLVHAPLGSVDASVRELLSVLLLLSRMRDGSLAFLFPNKRAAPLTLGLGLGLEFSEREGKRSFSLGEHQKVKSGKGGVADGRRPGSVVGSVGRSGV